MKFFNFFNNSCRRKGHDWEVTERSNTIQQDDMGYPLRLCIVTCKRCGETDQKWLDTDISALKEIENGKSVLLEWQKQND
jgi:hypothetical protein